MDPKWPRKLGFLAMNVSMEQFAPTRMDMSEAPGARQKGTIVRNATILTSILYPNICLRKIVSLHAANGANIITHGASQEQPLCLMVELGKNARMNERMEGNTFFLAVKRLVCDHMCIQTCHYDNFISFRYSLKQAPRGCNDALYCIICLFD